MKQGPCIVETTYGVKEGRSTARLERQHHTSIVEEVSTRLPPEIGLLVFK